MSNKSVFWFGATAMREERTEHCPTYEDFVARHKNPSNYMYFIDKFVRRVVSCQYFGGFCETEKLSKFVTVSDEAFALLVYENQEKRWEALFPYRNEKDKSKIPKVSCKYTVGTYKKGVIDGGTRRDKGWTNEGKIRFTSLCEDIEIERQSEQRLDFELRYLQSKQSKGKTKKPSNKKIYESDLEKPKAVYNELAKDIDLPEMEQFDPMQYDDVDIYQL